MPRYAVLRGRGRVQVLSYDGRGYFTVLTSRDVRVLVRRDRLRFCR
jgi:hypothetical protein